MVWGAQLAANDGENKRKTTRECERATGPTASATHEKRCGGGIGFCGRLMATKSSPPVAILDSANQTQFGGQEEAMLMTAEVR